MCEHILKRWNQYIEGKLLPLINDGLEGNIYSKHKSTIKCDVLIPKQKNIINVVFKTNPQNILEIGFNAGFSTLLIKMTAEQIGLKETKITCVDINEHPYVTQCYKKISQDYTNINLITQSSHDYLPYLHRTSKIRYDLIHIDGDHNISGAEQDLRDCLELSHKGTVIIFDDTNLKHLNDMCERFIEKGFVNEYKFNKIEGTTYNHRFLEVV